MMSTNTKTEIRLTRDAQIPRDAEVTIDVTVTYKVPWQDWLDNYNETSMSVNEFLETLDPLYGKHTPLGYVATQDGWEAIDEEASIAVNDVTVEEQWEQRARSIGGWTPANREYRENV